MNPYSCTLRIGSSRRKSNLICDCIHSFGIFNSISQPMLAKTNVLLLNIVSNETSAMFVACYRISEASTEWIKNQVASFTENFNKPLSFIDRLLPIVMILFLLREILRQEPDLTPCEIQAELARQGTEVSRNLCKVVRHREQQSAASSKPPTER